MRCTLALSLFLLFPAALNIHAQNIVGQWQGTLQTPRPVRIVLAVSRQADGNLQAYVVSVDQTPEHFPVTTISMTNGDVDFSIAMFPASYHGKFSDDGRRIDGTWTQGSTFHLDLQRSTKETSWLTNPGAVHSIAVAPGVSLEVIDWGGSGPPLVFLAGLGNTAHVFDNFAPKFVPQYHAYGITRRGFGTSSSPVPNGSNYSADQLGDDVLKVMDALGLKKPVLIGHSIAGEELSSIGSRFPEKIAGLIYLDAGYPYALYSATSDRPPNCCWLDTHLDIEELKTDLDTYLAGYPGGDQKQVLTRMLADLPHLQNDVEAEQKRAELLPPATGSGTGAKPPFADAADAIEKGEEKYSDIQVPILAIFASPHRDPRLARLADDQKAEYIALDEAQVAAQAKAFEKLKSAKVVIIPNADHYVFRSNEQEVEKDIRDFLSTLEAKRTAADPAARLQ